MQPWRQRGKDYLATLPSRGLAQVAMWLAAAGVGIIAVVYARAVTLVQGWFLAAFAAQPYLVALAIPVLTIAATALVVKLGPEARGSGIPQVLRAINTGGEPALVSLRTAAVKVLSSLVGILGGASIGREGPTVQIAASLFASIARPLRRVVPRLDERSFLVAGAAAGVAAAFNTPLAGITFAIEEIAEDAFASLKRYVMVAVIVAGVTAQGLAGDYLYFGHPAIDVSVAVIPQAIVIGLAGGLLGAGLARLVAFPLFNLLPQQWLRRALACGVAGAGLALIYSGDTAGSGYEITRQFMEGQRDALPLTLPLAKLAATVASYLSGMAGGIFAPTLAIGAGVGFSIGSLLGFVSLRVCALIGMVACFTGAVQAPLTAVIIVMEMTDQHVLVLPLLVSALVAHTVARLLMPEPLYRLLAAAAPPAPEA